MSCQHDCPPPAVFPQPIANRPGLARIDYRIGAYAELRDRMLDLLNKSIALAAWTHRETDDPGIALIEATAIVGDILTFYQQHYANEQYLRTAQWRESVAELVRLLGYRLAPGVGGEATFTLGVKGVSAVTVPKGFGLKAQLEGQDKPAEFESTAEITAYPHLGKFNLYRPMVVPNSANGTQTFFVYSASGIPEGLEFKSGDRVLVGTLAGESLAHAQILIVDQSWESFGDLYVKFTTALKWTGSVSALQAYKLGESYRHFGHNAPANVITVTDNVTTSATTSYQRNLNAVTSTNVDPLIDVDEMPLDSKADNFAAGAYLLIEARVDDGGLFEVRLIEDDFGDLTFALPDKTTYVRTVTAAENRSYTWGMLSGASTVLTLSSALAEGGGFSESVATGGVHAGVRMIERTKVDNIAFADVRTITLHEVVGAPFTLRAAYQPTAQTSGNQLSFYGTDAQAQPLKNRTLLLAGPDDAARIVTVTDVQALGAADADRNLFRTVTLDAAVSYANFDRAAPRVSVYGNLVPATQGKTQAEVTLGSGDRRQTFQTFALPKSPLTYLLDETHTPAQVPELHVYVDGVEWQAVDSFFNAGSDDAVYVVRENDDNQSFVQFGDGKTGRRLPSGVNNVTAVYRVGQAAYGDLKAGTTPSITGKLVNFDKLYLPAPVTVGAEREDQAIARVAAPGKMQSLGRMVSLADIEAEALMLPHVLKVRALWDAPEGVPLVRLTVLTQSGEAADVDAVRDSMRTFNRCRGPARYPIDVVQGIRQYVYLNIEAGMEASRREADVIAAVKQALGLAGEEGNGIEGTDGLFGLNARQFGQSAHRSQIIAAAQNVTGVTWVKLKAAQILNLGTPPQTDPTKLAKPAIDVVQTTLDCPGDRLLALYSAHFTLGVSKDEVKSECAT